MEGEVSAALIGGGVTLLVAIGKIIYDIFEKRKLKKQLEENCYTYKNLKNTRVISLIETLRRQADVIFELDCPLRNALFKDLLTLRYKLIKEGIADFIDKFDEEEYNAQVNPNIGVDIINLFSNIDIELTKKLTNDYQMPLVVINCFFDRMKESRKYSHTAVKSIADDESIHINNICARINAIFITITAMLETEYQQLFIVLSELNGEISNIHYTRYQSRDTTEYSRDNCNSHACKCADYKLKDNLLEQLNEITLDQNYMEIHGQEIIELLDEGESVEMTKMAKVVVKYTNYSQNKLKDVSDEFEKTNKTLIQQEKKLIEMQEDAISNANLIKSTQKALEESKMDQAGAEYNATQTQTIKNMSKDKLMKHVYIDEKNLEELSQLHPDTKTSILEKHIHDRDNEIIPTEATQFLAIQKANSIETSIQDRIVERIKEGETVSDLEQDFRDQLKIQEIRRLVIQHRPFKNKF